MSQIRNDIRLNFYFGYSYIVSYDYKYLVNYFATNNKDSIELKRPVYVNDRLSTYFENQPKNL